MIGILKKDDGDLCDVELEGGGIVKAKKINVGNIGDKTKLSVRPERVSINSQNTVNSFDGIVQELIYLGDHIRARLTVCNNDQFIVKIPNEGNLALKEQSSINVSWDPSDIRALDFN